MRKKIKYSNEPIEARVISDFLPNPEDLILKEKKNESNSNTYSKKLRFFQKCC